MMGLTLAVVLTIGLMYINIQHLKSTNKELTNTVAAQTVTISKYKLLVDAQAKQVKEDLDRSKVENDIKTKINELKKTNEDKPIGAIMSGTIDELRRHQAGH